MIPSSEEFLAIWEKFKKTGYDFQAISDNELTKLIQIKGRVFFERREEKDIYFAFLEERKNRANDKIAASEKTIAKAAVILATVVGIGQIVAQLRCK